MKIAEKFLKTAVKPMVKNAMTYVLLATAATSAQLACADSFTNDIGMEFVYITEGSFMMGSPDNHSEARSHEKPQHAVAISKPFYIGKYEVTQQHWQEVMGYNPYDLPRSNPYYLIPGMANRLNNPSNPATVSWLDANEFIKRLNEREGVERYRLPTEAEWEYVARAGTETDYSFGDDSRELSRYAWHGESFGSGSSHPVGQKLPNGWGLYDMHGNVWEWVNDWYADDYYSRSPDKDPLGPEQGEERVVRGGSWHNTATSWRSAFRRSYEPDYRGISIGFRVVAEVEQ